MEFDVLMGLKEHVIVEPAGVNLFDDHNLFEEKLVLNFSSSMYIRTFRACSCNKDPFIEE